MVLGLGFFWGGGDCFVFKLFFCLFGRSKVKRHVYGITFIRYDQSKKKIIGKPNNSKVSERRKTKRPTQDSQNRLRSPMSEVR